MPELAEVEHYRKQWRHGAKQRILAVETSTARVFRGVDLDALRRALTGATLLDSRAHGKQMLFRFSKNAWLGLHLGMTGELRCAPGNAARAKHDHLVLRQRSRALVFNDPRQFGRIRFDISPSEPEWWRKLPPPILSPRFTLAAMKDFLRRHSRAPAKAVLLSQAGFPGIGNWMADEILWRARILPSRVAGRVTDAEVKRLFDAVRFVARGAMRSVAKGIAKGFGDPPPGWLFHHRWKRGQKCPRCGAGLRHAQVGGRTTCWCPHCQT